jgi:hypothetical protein
MPRDSLSSSGSSPAVFFNSFRSGMFYSLTDYLVLTGDEEVTIPFPCQISVNGRCKVVVTEVDGLIDTVKEDMGFSGYSLNISFEAGDYTLPEMEGGSEGRFYKAREELVARLANLVRTHKGEVGITEGASVHQSETGDTEAQEPLLAVLGIKKVVLQSIDIRPTKNRRYQVTLAAVAEMDENVNLFPTEKEYQEQSRGGE